MKVLLEFLVFLVAVLYVRATDDGNLRLISSAGRTSSLTAGRLEIFYDDEWGTVCDDGFGMTDAIAACRQLGFEGAINFNNAGSLGYPQTSRPILLDDVDCASTNIDLIDCSHRTIGSHNCGHSEDVILSCLIENSLRLSISSGSVSVVTLSGRLEIYIDDQWGTVCDDAFTDTSADVACRQIGFAGAASWTSIRSQSRFPSALSSTRIWLDEVRCRSSDLTLRSCRHNGAGVHDCTHIEDVVLFCDTGSSSSDDGSTTTTSAASVIGSIVGAIFFFLFICIPFCICAVFFYSASSGRRRRWRHPPQTRMVAVATATTTSTNQQGNIFVPPSQQAPPVHPTAQVQQDKYPQMPTGVLQDAPPPSYDAAAAYPSPYAQPPPQALYYGKQPPAFPLPNQPYPQDVGAPAQNQPSAYPPPPQAAYPPQGDAYPSQGDAYGQPPQSSAYPQQPPDGQPPPAAPYPLNPDQPPPAAPYPSNPAYPPPVGYANQPAPTYPDADTPAPSAPPA